MLARPSPAVLVRSLSVGLVLLIFGIFAILVWRGYGDTLTRATDRAQTGANVITEETRWLVGAVRQALREVNTAVDGDPGRLTPQIWGDLQAQLDQLPTSLTLAVYDSSGRLIPSVDGSQLPADISPLPLFAKVRDGSRWGIAAVPRAAGGAPDLVVAERLSAGGVFTGVAAIHVTGSVLEAFWAPLGLGPDAAVGLISEDGWIIARYPPIEAPTNIAESDSFKTHLSASTTGSYLATSQLDGVRRIVAYRQMPELGLIATATVSQAATIGAFWNAVIIVLLLLAPIAAMLLGSAIWTARILSRLQHALDQNAVLFREVHHRVKNNLQSVSALIQLQPMDAESKRDLISRIEAMAAVHEHLYRSDTFESIAAQHYLHSIVEGISRGFPDAVRAIENIADVSIGKDAAVPLGLVVNEVVTNAYKHGFPGGNQGTIRIDLERVGEDRARLIIADDGVGFDASKPAKGMGRRLLTGLVRQLQGEFEFVNESGSRFVMTFPLDGHGATVPARAA